MPVGTINNPVTLSPITRSTHGPMTTGERVTVITGVLVMVIALITLVITLIWILPNQSQTHIKDDREWPVITRTVDGSPTVVQPEDLDDYR